MKKNYFRILFAIFLFLSLIGTNKYVYAHDHHEQMKGSKPTSNSIYWLGGKWKNMDNKIFELKSFSGYPVVITMLYTNCADICPLITSYIQSVEQGLKPEEIKKTKFVIVSIDPEHDTPKKLAEFAKSHLISEKNWKLLNGSQRQVLELATLLGIKYKKTNDGQFSHTTKIIVLNKKGEISYETEDIKAPIAPVVIKIRNLLGK